MMEAYGRTLPRHPNEYERVQRGSSSPLGIQSPEAVPFQPTSSSKKKKKKASKLAQATQSATIGSRINPGRPKEPFANQPLNVVPVTQNIKSSGKKVHKQKAD